MKSSPLQLVRCYFSKIQIEANPEVKPRRPTGVFATKTELVPLKEKPLSWQVTLTVRLDPKANSEPPPYIGEMKVVGLFQVDSEFPAETRAALVTANAPAVLFGMAREMVANLTARGPHPMVCLPTVTFIDEISKPKPPVPEPVPASDSKDATAGAKGDAAKKAKRRKG